LDVVDVVAGDLIRSIAIDINAVAFLGAALYIVDMVAQPLGIVAIAGDARYVGAFGRRSRCVQTRARLIC
jgi:hypothetical protein